MIFVLCFWIYGVLSLAHIFLQIIFGMLENKRVDAREWVSTNYSSSVIVPVYKENPAILNQCINSILHQNGAIEVIIVDDGSPNRQELVNQVYSRLDNKCKVIYLPENVGKRRAQKAAFDIATGEFFVTVDSDTILHDNLAITKLMSRLTDPTVGAVSGRVAVENKQRNVLTRLINWRYWMAFNQERAAQSLFGVVMCCSGPFSAYRATIVKQVAEEYVSQKFLGQECTFGDDRHLTNLILKNNYRVVYDHLAVAYTHVPEDIKTYSKQQLRWNKSFYREMLWTARFIHRKSFYLGYDLLMQAVLPLFLLAALIITIVLAFVGTWHVLIWYSATIIFMGLLRALYATIKTRDPQALIFSFYGLLHVFLLLPIRLYALANLRTTHWGTR